jgi:hypothetical protein
MTGAFRHDPQRKANRSSEPKPNGPIGAPPPHWAKPGSYPVGALQSIWDEYIAEAPPGVLTISDRKLLEFLCVETYEARRPGSKGAARARESAAKLLAKLGMNPTDRARMNMPVEQPKDPLAAFLNRKKA